MCGAQRGPTWAPGSGKEGGGGSTCPRSCTKSTRARVTSGVHMKCAESTRPSAALLCDASAARNKGHSVRNSVATRGSPHLNQSSYARSNSGCMITCFRVMLAARRRDGNHVLTLEGAAVWLGRMYLHRWRRRRHYGGGSAQGADISTDHRAAQHIGSVTDCIQIQYGCCA